MRIMVVDDEQDVKLLFEQRFRKEIRQGRISFHFEYSGEAALKYLQTFSALGGIMEAENRHDDAIQLYKQGLEVDNLEEVFYRNLMICYEKLGKYADAVKVYLRCKETLSVLLGVSPNPATQKIYERVISRR